MYELPIDVATLNKGDVISRNHLAKILRERPRTYAYSYKVACLVAEIQKALSASGRTLSVCHKDQDILILTDSEAVHYNKKRFRKARKCLVQAHRRMEAVDVANLTQEERREHERVIVVQGAIIAGSEAARKAVQPLVYQRKTPGLATAGQ